MSLAAAVESAKLNNAHNYLILDIERLPGRFTADFWDMGSFKNRRIHPDMVIEWPRTICVAWKFVGTKRVEFASEWDDGPEQMHRRIWEAIDRAQIVSGHNSDRFDVRKLNTGFREHCYELRLPTPAKPVDTLKEARKVFGDESMTLDALCARMGIARKTDRYEVEVARAACAGDKKAQRRIKLYNCGDVGASEALVTRMRGYMPNHPHSLVGTADDRPTCNQCWGDNLVRNGTKLAQQITYVLYRCQDCGANVQGTRHSRAAITRGAR